jgi:hypothetical protein
LDKSPALPAPVVESTDASEGSEYQVNPSEKKKFEPIIRVRNPQLIDVENNEGGVING